MERHENLKIGRMHAKVLLSFALLHSVALLFLASPAHAIFDSTQYTGARPLSMGGAYVAVADEANAININPSGLSQLKVPEISLSYSNMYGISNLSDNYLAFALPYGLNSFGASYRRLSLIDIYKEETFTASYARELRQTVSVGVNFKALRLSVGNFSASDASSNSSDTEWSTDLGVWAHPAEPLTAGFVVQDLNSPRLRLLSNSSGELIYPTFRSGFAYRPKSFVIFSGDIHTEKGTFRNLGNNYHFGFEIFFAKTIGLRLGVDRSKFTGGIGFELRKTSIDFGFYNQGELGLLYRVSAAFRWGA